MMYSELYYKIRDNIESTWPQWKIDYCNQCLLISKHSRKLERKINLYDAKDNRAVHNEL